MTQEKSRVGTEASESLDRPLRVLFLCTANSARSQIAEAILANSGSADFEAASAGSSPGARVHPDAVRVLAERGIDWSGRTPKGIDDVIDQRWDVVITVCDDAREACPILPGQPVSAHWGIPDPAGVEGEDERRRAFQEAARYLARRIELMLELPVEKLEAGELKTRLGRIASEK